YIYGFEYIKLKNGAGNGLDLKSLRLNIFPQLISASIRIPKVRKLKLVLGTFLRGRTNVRFSLENEGNYETISGSPGTEYYKARAEFSNNLFEQWFGIGLAYKINEKFSVGATSYGAYTHLEVRSFENMNADGLANGVPYNATVNAYSLMRLNQITQVFKVGFAARFQHVHLGLALTLPGIKIWGKGKLDKSFEVHNLNQNPVDTNAPGQKYPSFVISDVQKGLKSHYTIPFSVSAGIKVAYPKFKIAVSAEYFMGHKSKVMLQGDDRAFIRPQASYTDTIKGFMTLQTSARPVINVGIGAEIKIKPKVNLLLGTRTDFNNRAEYLPANEALGILSTKSPAWHYLYFSAGATYKLTAHNITAGFDYGLGIPIGSQQIFNITDPKQELFLRGNLNQGMKTSVHKLNFILSYVYFFKAKEKKTDLFSVVDELKTKKKKKHKK
ncbi:MAG: hypothetical protein V4615_07045, partial [Bacteroidota bacterium]